MSPASKKLREHIGIWLSIRLSVRSSKTVHASVMKFHIWIPHGKIVDTLFFSCPSYAPLKISLPGGMPLWKNGNEIWCMPYLMNTMVLKFHIWIPHGKIADPYFFSCLSYLPFWSYAPLKKSAWNLVSKISRKVFELGAWNLVSL